jgi:hypothetical protein
VVAVAGQLTLEQMERLVGQEQGELVQHLLLQA